MIETIKIMIYNFITMIIRKLIPYCQTRIRLKIARFDDKVRRILQYPIVVDTMADEIFLDVFKRFASPIASTIRRFGIYL